MAEHWYTWHGECAYEIKGANGKIRSTTLRDAKRHNYLPSFTGIVSILDKAGLNLAKNRLVAEEMFKMFFEDKGNIHENDIAYMRDEAIRRAGDHWSKASDAGTIIHDAIEASLSNPSKYNPNQEVLLAAANTTAKVSEYVDVAHEWIENNGIEIDRCEVVCVNKDHGYAGKTDILATYKGEPILIDWKTTKTKESQKPKDMTWDTHCMQIAAYSKCLWESLPSTGINVYLSTTELDPKPRLESVWWTKDQMQESYDKFIAIFNTWKLIKKYNPVDNTT
jgi:hypothetical protein